MHTSGLYDYASDPKFVEYVLTHGRHHWTRAEQVRFAMTHGKPYAAPGKEFHYADTGYVLLGEIIERTTGRPLAERVPPPARLRQARARGARTSSRSRRGRRRRSRVRTSTTSASTRPAFDPSFDLYGGGGLVSTVDDLARFYRALLHGQRVREERDAADDARQAEPAADRRPRHGHLLQPDRRPLAARTAGPIPASGAPR